MTLDATTAMIALLAMTCWEITRWTVQRFLKTTAGTKYVTEAECRACREVCITRNNIAVTAMRKDLKQLKNVVIRYLLMTTIPADTAAREELERLMDG